VQVGLFSLAAGIQFYLLPLSSAAGFIQIGWKNAEV